MTAAIGRLALLVGGLLVVLTYLLVRAATPDPAQHERMLDAFRALALHDAALRRDVLQARAGLLRNYDPLVQAIANLRNALADLQELEGSVAGEAGAAIDRDLVALSTALNDEEAATETFKSANAILQNSLSYFTHISRQFALQNGNGGEAVADAVAALGNAMLQFVGDPRAEVGVQVTAELDRLADLTPSPELQEQVAALEVHGRLIVERLPVVDEVVRHLLDASTTTQAKALQDRYLDQREQVETRARFFRILLYLAALMLLGYLTILFLRLRANTRALRARLDFERLIAGISTQFINLSREQIDHGIQRGLERLAGHLGVDRAHIVMDDDDDAGEHHRSGHGWSRTGPPLPPIDSEVMRSISNAGHDGGGGPIVIPSIGGLPPGPLREYLAARDVRSWFCVPMQAGGGRIGWLAFEAVQAEQHWSKDDRALLGTAAEIFANAIERARAETEKEALEARLRQAQRMEAIGTLAGGIAHDFNNILGAILGYAEMALSALPRGSRTERYVQQVMQAGERAKGVIEQILAFSRSGAREHGPVQILPLIEEAIGLLRATLPSTVAIEARLHAEQAVVVGNAAQLQQAVINLCTNAAQAMAGHGVVAVEVAIVDLPEGRELSHGTLVAGSYVRLRVNDTGHGIDAPTMERIFEPFFTTRAAGGTGLGLASVHGIVADHGGALNVRSRPGAGSCFEAYFPCSEAKPMAAEQAELSACLGHGETVLLVDDEEPLVLLGEEMLAALGYEPVGFDSGNAALAAFRTDPQRFDLVLADEMMAEFTGTQLAAALHAIRRDLPIVLMTGYSGPVSSRALEAAGIREVLRKPLRARDLADCLARYLKSPDRSRAPGLSPKSTAT